MVCSFKSQASICTCSVFCSEGNSIAENTVDTWTKLLMLPKCVLPTAKRGGQHNKHIPINTLCGLWLKGNLCDLAHTRVAISKQSKRAPSNKVVASAISLAKDGLYGKACQMVTSQGIAPNDDNTWNLLVSKHPQGDCPSNPAAPSVEAVLKPDFNIIPVLTSFSKLAGAGPTGLHIQHLIDVAEVPLSCSIQHYRAQFSTIVLNSTLSCSIQYYRAQFNTIVLNSILSCSIQHYRAQFNTIVLNSTIFKGSCQHPCCW